MNAHDDLKLGKVYYSEGPVLSERMWIDSQHFTPTAETDREVRIVLAVVAFAMAVMFGAGVWVGRCL